MNPRTRAAIALAVAVLVGTACGGDDDEGDTARIDSGQPSAGSEVGDSVTPATGDDDGTDDTDGTDGTDTTEADDAGSGSGAGATPEDQALDLSVRNDSGISVTLSRIGFEGQDIVVEAQVINAARDEATFHLGNYASDRLRLVDDAGEEYNLIEVEEDQPIKLVPGDTLDADLAFRGPLHGRPERLYFVTNVPTDRVESFDADTEPDSTIFPKFVIPVDLAWG